MIEECKDIHKKEVTYIVKSNTIYS